MTDEAKGEAFSDEVVERAARADADMAAALLEGLEALANTPMNIDLSVWSRFAFNVQMIAKRLRKAATSSPRAWKGRRMGDYTSIIEALEGAKEGSRELDARVYALVKAYPGEPGRWTEVGPPTFKVIRYFWCPDPKMAWLGYDLLNIAPAWTTSLDAALALVREKLPGANTMGHESNPKGAEAYVSRNYVGEGHWLFEGNASTAPIALLIALFTALQAKEAKTDE
jgi:hypothetical protein